MLIKIVLVCVFGALTLWMCNIGLRRGARTPQDAVLGGVPEEPACPKCGGPTADAGTPCPACKE